MLTDMKNLWFFFGLCGELLSNKIMLQWKSVKQNLKTLAMKFISDWILIYQYWIPAVGFLLPFFMLYISVVHTLHLKLFIII
jgi:hypothetical protein